MHQTEQESSTWPKPLSQSSQKAQTSNPLSSPKKQAVFGQSATAAIFLYFSVYYCMLLTSQRGIVFHVISLLILQIIVLFSILRLKY